MKKTYLLILAALLFFAACKKDETNNTPTPTPPVTMQSQLDGKVVSYSSSWNRDMDSSKTIYEGFNDIDSIGWLGAAPKDNLTSNSNVTYDTIQFIGSNKIKLGSSANAIGYVYSGEYDNGTYWGFSSHGDIWSSTTVTDSVILSHFNVTATFAPLVNYVQGMSNARSFNWFIPGSADYQYHAQLYIPKNLSGQVYSISYGADSHNLAGWFYYQNFSDNNGSWNSGLMLDSNVTNSFGYPNSFYQSFWGHFDYAEIAIASYQIGTLN